ncbi:tetratricopeptide repeat protein [Sorangium sp. So ce542]|uniref:tetratricopeptide repeat protein n=1 Tax=Sorangium sp. So ce542 TaxID=3133316 RepID=UPI003F61B378
MDVLVVTAIQEEYDEVLRVDTGADPSSTWQAEPGPIGLDIAFRTFVTADRRPLRIAVTRALEMGGIAATNAAAPLVTIYRPRCIAMCGVCAGRRGSVNLGDVIIADRLWTYNTGSTVVEKDEQGREVSRFRADPSAYNLNARWKHRAESFRPEGLELWAKERPRSHEDQADWLLSCLCAGRDPVALPDRRSRCEDFGEIVVQLRERGWLEPTGLRLTEAGRAHIGDRLLLHPDGLPEPEDFAILVGPIGTGTTVVRDPLVFDKLSVHMRKVLGLEMEAAAIGAIAHLHSIEHMIVMKGVMDYADKRDNFKRFAARASAECLIAFLRANWPPGEPRIRAIDTPPEPGGPPTTLPNYGGLFFADRREEREAIERALDKGGDLAVCVLYGQPGVGKTRLAVEYARAHIDRYPGGVFFVRFNRLPPNDLAEVLRLLGLPEYNQEPPDEQCRRALRSLGGRATLLIYDGVASEADLDAWRPPYGSRCHLLATSTRQYWTGRHEACLVRALSDDQARSIASALLGEPAARGRWVEPLVKQAGGIAVQLCAAAASVARALARGRTPGLLEGLFKETEESFATAWALLPEDGRLLLRVAALFEASRVPADTLWHLLEGEGWREQRFDDALHEVLDRSLLARSGETFRLHDLLRRFIGGRSAPELSDGLLERWRLCSEEAERLALARPNDIVLASRLQSYPDTAWERFADVLRVEAGKVAHASGMALLQSGKWDTPTKDAAIRWFQRAVYAKSKGDAGGRVDYHSLGSSLHELGWCTLETGRYDEARSWFQQALTAKREAAARAGVDHRQLGKTLRGLGECFYKTNQFEESLRWFELAVSEHQQGDAHGDIHHEELGRTLNNVGVCLLRLKRVGEAIPWFKRAVAAHQRGDVRGRVHCNELGSSLHNIGRCLFDIGEFEEARQWYERAVAAYHKDDVRRRVDYRALGMSLHGVGQCLSAMGRFDEARPWLARAVHAHGRGDIHGKVDGEALAASRRALEELPVDQPCPCGSGTPFRACHGASEG